MKIEIRNLVDIVPYKQNARKIPQRAIDKVALSLKEFGWQQPIVIDKKGVIVVGHTRWLAAQQLGWTEAPVHVADNLTAAQIRQYRLMDNRSHEETAWDLDILGLELKEMKGLDIDLELAGFDIFMRPIVHEPILPDLRRRQLVGHMHGSLEPSQLL